MGARVIVGYEAEKSPLGLKENLATVWRLLKSGIDFPPTFERSKESELRELVAPHIPVLVHKRERFSVQDEQGLKHWTVELHSFIDRVVLPLLGIRGEVTGNDRNRLVRLIDTFVSDEVERAKAAETTLPLTSRFDTSWAI
ncbi:MAG: hypothetical protein HY243_18670 [Proteobacteria bacterium]|nr:hypothetical protein [Pseudomonadota bacterium]